ncbi:MAG: zf-HC2 domain-containing protein [Bacteroidota bacterium]|nr:zf-HC2 domain-containing protein [Bacteroidota bacterium]
MNCTEVEKIMDAYADGEVSDIDCNQVSKHIQDCKHCHEKWENSVKYKSTILSILKKCCGEDVKFNIKEMVLKSEVY